MRRWGTVAALLGILATEGLAENEMRSAAGCVDGIVMNEATPLPGVTVTILAGEISRVVMTDERGTVKLAGLEPGSYTIRCELEGLKTATHTVVVDSGPCARFTADMPVELTAEQLTLACRACRTTPPSSRYQSPMCAEYDMGATAIDAMKLDPSALGYAALLWETTGSIPHRLELSAALLGSGGDDTRYWNDLEAAVETALSVRRTTDRQYPDDFIAACEREGESPDTVWSVSVNALMLASRDARSRPLLLRALRTGDEDVIAIAVQGLAMLQAEETLPQIHDALLELPSEIRMNPAAGLAMFESEAADAIAAEVLDHPDYEDYLRIKDSQSESAAEEQHEHR